MDTPLTGFQHFQNTIADFNTPILLVVGIIILFGFFMGKLARLSRLPSIIGYMIIGALLGPSLFNLLSEPIQGHLSFITDVCLGFVALNIGLELKWVTLKQQGWGMMLIIFMESFVAFILVTLFVWLLTKDAATALIFGAIAPASAPAGTVAIIQEYKAKGPLTKALYTVVGFDDGLGIIIFGFASAFAKSILLKEGGIASATGLGVFAQPLIEIALSLTVGGALAALFKGITLKMKNATDIFILTVAFVLAGCGLSTLFHLSLILTNMIFGIIIVNICSAGFISKVTLKLEELMPLLFVLFFLLAGSNLKISALPSLGVLGIVYIIGRTSGLMGGAYLGALFSKAATNIRRYLGMGILSQAGVAIGLSLIVKKEFSALINPAAEAAADPLLSLATLTQAAGGSLSTAAQQAAQHAMAIGSNAITIVTATCIFFEIVGPITTKIALKKAGEISIS